MMKEVATITLALAFIIHVSSIINNLLYPDLPTFKHYSKNLKDIDFPIAFRICAEKLQDEEQKFNSVGYRNMWDFFLGKSMYGSAYGWAGHSKNGSNSLQSQLQLWKLTKFSKEHFYPICSLMEDHHLLLIMLHWNMEDKHT